MWEKIKEQRDVVIVAIVAFLIGFGSASFFKDNGERSILTRPFPEELAEEEDGILPPLGRTAEGRENNIIREASANMTVNTQPAAVTVSIAEASLGEAMWIVIHEDENGDLGNILGALWLTAGTHTDKEVELLRGTVGGNAYHAVFHEDKGEAKKFNLKEDLPLVEDSAPVGTTFRTIASPHAL